MADFHLTRDLLRAAAGGEIPAAVLTDLALEHLLSLCPHCREEYQAWREERRRGASDYSRAFGLLPAVLDSQISRGREVEGRVERDFEALLAFPAEERTPRIRRARSRFRDAGLVHRLLSESRTHLQSDPSEAFHFAELARVVAEHLRDRSRVIDLLALSSATMGNARRAAGNLPEADDHFGHVRHLVRTHGVTDSKVLARISELESSLRKDQRRLPEALELLARAVLLYQASGDFPESARIRLKLASTYFYQGAVTRAIETLRAAFGSGLSKATDERLYLCARFNLTLYLVEQGSYQDAQELLAQDRPFYVERLPEERIRLRLSWLEGKLSAGLGESGKAEQSFFEVRDGFLAREHPFDAALVSLDLALLYLAANRTSELLSLAVELVAIFGAQGVHREVVAVLALLREAAEEQAVSASLIRELKRRVTEARENPALSVSHRGDC